MPYDQSLDECVERKVYEYDGGSIVLSVHSYNQGPKKLQIARENKTADGDVRFAKLGRMTKSEVAGILPLLQEVADNLDDPQI